MASPRSSEASLRATIAADGRTLPGTLVLPRAAKGVVLFARNRGTAALTPQHHALAAELHQAGFGTLVFDLLTDREAQDRDRVFDVRLLSLRLLHATEWVESQPETAGLPLGYYGSDVAAAAAVVAASQAGRVLRAIVLRGGRPDLAFDFLPQVPTPTLLIVGGRDPTIVRLNRHALERLGGVKAIEVIEDASHDLSEPEAVAAVGRLAVGWFRQHLMH